VFQIRATNQNYNFSNGMTNFLINFWNLRQILGLLDVKCLYQYSIVFALAALLWPLPTKAEIPNLSEILVHFSKTRLFETPCIKPPYNRRKLMNRANTWRWVGTAKLPGLAARGRQSCLPFFAQYLRDVTG